MEAAPTAGCTALPKGLPLRLARLSDERLARLVRSGHERAFAALYERYHQPLYRYCRSLLREDTDAQDVLQSTFASALAALQQDKRNAPLRPWLFRIAHNEAISLHRRRRVREEEMSDSLVPTVASAADQAEERARIALLIADLDQLPERQRGALLMRELSGLSHADIAVVLGTSVGAAKQAIFDARSSLLELAEGRAMACEEVRRKISERDGRSLRGRRLRSHLRDCPGCAAFAVAIPERRSDLQAVAPLLPAASSAALLARLARGTTGHGAGGATATGGATTAGAVGKLGGAALISKTVVGAAVLATAAAGVGGLTNVLPLAGPRDRSGNTPTEQIPGASARPRCCHTATGGGAAAPSIHQGRTAGRGSHARSGAPRSATSAAGSSGQSTAGVAHGSRGTASAGAGHVQAGGRAESAQSALHRQTAASHRQTVAAHRQSGAARNRSGESRAAHHATGVANASQRAGGHASNGSGHASGPPQPAVGSRAGGKQPVRVSPPVHASPGSTTARQRP